MDLRSRLSQAIISEENTFDVMNRALMDYSKRPTNNLKDLKGRKQASGDLWEQFCQWWLQHRYLGSEVWPLREFPEDLRQSLKLRRQDIGIDLIMRFQDHWYPIQAKFRTNQRKISWKELSTFWGLVARTGPWYQHIVMTNTIGITWKVPKRPNDLVIGLTQLRNTSYETWMSMAGRQGHRFSDSSLDPVDPALVRQHRLDYFDKY